MQNAIVITIGSEVIASSLQYELQLPARVVAQTASPDGSAPGMRIAADEALRGVSGDGVYDTKACKRICATRPLPTRLTGLLP
ncbi:MAG: hypothetical protein EKK49_17605 [Rhodocyclaceae bacterium]|nr:MAG: hypothetical protein EKK49_17605 [Rhodocyclaceae bacterium]